MGSGKPHSPSARTGGGGGSNHLNIVSNNQFAHPSNPVSTYLGPEPINRQTRHLIIQHPSLPSQLWEVFLSGPTKGRNKASSGWDNESHGTSWDLKTYAEPERVEWGCVLQCQHSVATCGHNILEFDVFALSVHFSSLLNIPSMMRDKLSMAGKMSENLSRFQGGAWFLPW